MTVVTSNNISGSAVTACRVDFKNKFLVYAIGSDWCKGILELESYKKAKIIVYKIKPD
jgi:hypothetical protein